MLTPCEMERVREKLETFMATVRPGSAYRGRFDVSYRLTAFALVIDVHQPAGETSALIPQSRFKAVHNDDPSGWLLYVPDSQGHWVVNDALVFTPTLDDALELALSFVPKEPPPEVLGQAG